MARKSLRTNHSSGWLQVLTVPGGAQIALPEYLQVEHEGTRVNIPPTQKGISGAAVTGQMSGKIYNCKQTPPKQAYYFPTDPEGREREFFTILEGPHRGKKAAVLAHGKPLFTACPRRSPCPREKNRLLERPEEGGEDGAVFPTA